MRNTYLLLLAITIFLGYFILPIINDKASAHGGSYGFAKIRAKDNTLKITLLIDTLSIAEF